MNKEDLIHNLTENLEPVQVIPSVAALMLKWLSVTIVILLALAAVVGIRDDIAMMKYDYFFIIETLLGIFSAFSAAYLAFSYMRPEYKASLFTYMLGFSSVTIWIYLIGIYLHQIQYDFSRISEHLMNEEHFCSVQVFGFSALPLIYLFIILKKGAVVEKATAGFFGVLSVASLSAITSRYTCSSDMPSHVLTQHFLEVFMLGIIGMFIAKKLLKW